MAEDKKKRGQRRGRKRGRKPSGKRYDDDVYRAINKLPEDSVADILDSIISEMDDLERTAAEVEGTEHVKFIDIIGDFKEVIANIDAVGKALLSRDLDAGLMTDDRGYVTTISVELPSTVDLLVDEAELAATYGLTLQDMVNQGLLVTYFLIYLLSKSRVVRYKAALAFVKRLLVYSAYRLASKNVSENADMITDKYIVSLAKLASGKDYRFFSTLPNPIELIMEMYRVLLRTVKLSKKLKPIVEDLDPSMLLAIVFLPFVVASRCNYATDVEKTKICLSDLLSSKTKDFVNVPERIVVDMATSTKLFLRELFGDEFLEELRKDEKLESVIKLIRELLGSVVGAPDRKDVDRELDDVAIDFD